MKTLRLTLAIIVVAFLTCSNSIKAQTVQQEISFSLDGWTYCPDSEGSFRVSGYILEHFTIFYNPNTGKVERIHNNVLHSNIYNTDTGEKLQVVDSGNDNLGFWWWQWGIPREVPFEGIAEGTFKIIGKGELYHYKFMLKFHINAEGVPEFDFVKGWEECN